jgi:hypothetical protein
MENGYTALIDHLVVNVVVFSSVYYQFSQLKPPLKEWQGTVPNTTPISS